VAPFRKSNLPIRATFFLAIALALAVSAPAVAAPSEPSIPAARPGLLGAQPNVVIHDAVLPLRRGARAAAASGIIPSTASSGTYPSHGMMIKIAVSRSYTPNAAESQSWADFLGGLPQHGDASSMTVYFAPLKEMQSICGVDSDACYDPGEEVLVLLGETAPDGASIEEVAAHEFGHHIANNRNNAPWSADSWGPKRWATYQGICQGVPTHKFYPDDEGAHYDLNPAEGWAETYRVAAGQNPTDWSIVSNTFKHGTVGLKTALSDAMNPWAGNVAKTVSGSFTARAAAVKRIKLSVPLDGRVTVSASTGGMRLGLDLFDGADRTRLASSAAASRASSLRSNVCGQRTVVVHLKRSSGSGSYKLTTSVPAP